MADEPKQNKASMNRAEKIALLTNVLQQSNSHTNRQRLQRVRENAPRSLVIIDDLDFELGQPMTDTDPVHFKDKGQEHQMTLGEAYQYARRYSIRTLIVLPAKRPI